MPGWKQLCAPQHGNSPPTATGTEDSTSSTAARPHSQEQRPAQHMQEDSPSRQFHARLPDVSLLPVKAQRIVHVPSAQRSTAAHHHQRLAKLSAHTDVEAHRCARGQDALHLRTTTTQHSQQ